MRWHQEVLLILEELPHMKDGVPGVHPILCILLLHADKICCVGAREGTSAVSVFYCEAAYLGGETGESGIERHLDVVIVFLLRASRVEISY